MYFVLCALSFALFILSDLPAFRVVGHLKYGCYIRDAMVSYVECEGLFLEGAVELAYNLWFILVYGCIFMIDFPRGTIFGLVVLSPGLYLLWYVIFGRALARKV